MRMSFLSYRARKLFYAVVLVLLLFTLIRVIFPNEYIILDRNQQLKEIARLIQSGNQNAKVWGERAGCKHPQLEVNAPDMMKFVKWVPPLVCRGEEDWVQVSGSVATITSAAKKLHGDIECSFTDIHRANEFVTRMGLTTTTHTEYNLEAADFVRVRCASESGSKWSSVLSGVRHDQDVADRTGWDLLPPSAMHLNVLVMGFDSLSRNSFIRKLPESYRYLKENLDAHVLQGYNIVGDGTPQALIPMLTGKTELELPDTRKRMGEKASYVNVYPFVWNEFQSSGYVTAYAEDTPNVGIFTHRLKGFKDTPTDHYMRTFYIEAQSDYSRFSTLCIGSIPRHKSMLDYAKHMYTVYRDKPKFFFGFHGEISHDDYNQVGCADKDLKEWLAWFKDNNHLNNTILALISDHGHRFAKIRNTEQGRLEERLPWFAFIVPPWFSKVYPEAAAALKHNAGSSGPAPLTTPFDIHSTFREILHFNRSVSHAAMDHRSLSLWHKIPIGRSCVDAYVEPHWCACLDWEAVDVKSSIIARAAEGFVQFINKYNREYTNMCASMELSSIQWAARLLPSTALRRYSQAADVDGFVPKMASPLDITLITYQLKLTTIPGHAIFEISTVYSIKKDIFTYKIQDVSRVNQYGSQARCIENTMEQLRKFCYCMVP